MFVILATKPLNDGTDGFRYNFFGIKGMIRVRKVKWRWGFSQGKTMKAIHVGKYSLYVERKTNRKKHRKFGHWAG